MSSRCKVTLSHRGHKLGRPPKAGAKHQPLHHRAKAAAKKRSKAKPRKVKQTTHRHKHTEPKPQTCVHHQRGRPKGSKDKTKRHLKTR